MADVAAMPGDLRSLARRVPDDVRESLTDLELQLRCTEAFNVIADADLLTDEVKKSREKARASRILKACAPTGYFAVTNLLEAQIREAELRGDHRRAFELHSQVNEFRRANPQVSPETAMAALKAEVSRVKIPPVPQGNLWTRRNRRH